MDRFEDLQTFVAVVEAGSFRKSGTRTVRAHIVRIGERDCFDIRVYADGDPDPVPTKQGICASLDHLPELAGLVEKLQAYVEEHTTDGTE